jgi:tRNA pseudouridine(55) synthase
MSPEKYVLLNKAVGETPLEVLEAWRTTRPDLANVPMAYAGRLDPMASGQLLVLIGEECKKQEEYHDLDKEYQVEILFGAHSDSGDVLGIVTSCEYPEIKVADLNKVLENLIGEIELPYPVFSSKTILGKPLHTWVMENRLHEITIPTRRSHIYQLSLNKLSTLSRQEVTETALTKIELIPKVTDPRKALGNDFRRPAVRLAWQEFKASGSSKDVFYLANFTCICSSGTYMRTLAEVIANKLDTKGLAFSIHRSTIGKWSAAENSWSMKF